MKRVFFKIMNRKLSTNKNNNNNEFLFFSIFAIIALAIAFFSFGILEFEDHKEFPHICVMSEFQPDDHESFVVENDADDERDTTSSKQHQIGYKLYKYHSHHRHHHSSSAQQEQEQDKKQQQQIHDTVYFVHGNSGDHGQARWMFAEFSKLLAGTTTNNNKNSNNNKDDQVEVPHIVDLYSFAFNEEANIHSGTILERQASFVVESILRKQKQVLIPNSRKRCTWLLSHSMGGVVARVAAERLLSSTSSFRGVHVDVCGIFVLSSPQTKLPIHLDSRISRISEQYEFKSGDGDTEKKKTKTKTTNPITGIIVSASNGAADIQVYENSVSRLNKRVRSEALVSVDLSTVSMAGLSTSHHGITYCHQLVRPLMKSLIWMMSVKRITETLKSARHLHIVASSSDENNQEEPEKVAEIRRVLTSCFYASSSPTMIGLWDESDADPKIKTMKENWLDEMMKDDYKICQDRPTDNFNDLKTIFSQKKSLILSATKPFDSVKKTKKKNNNNNQREGVVSSSLFELKPQKKKIESTSSSSSPISFGIPWRTAHHDVFELIRDEDNSGGESSGFTFLKSLTIVEDLPTYDQTLAALKKKSSNDKDVSSKKLKELTLETLKTTRKEKINRAKSSAENLLLSSPTTKENEKSLYHHSPLITNSQSRIFWQQANISGGSAAFWIRVGLKISKNQKEEENKENNRTLLPVVVARCASTTGMTKKKSMKKKETSDKQKNENEIRFLIPLHNSEMHPEGLTVEDEKDDNKNNIILHHQFSWMWMPIVTGTIDDPTATKKNKSIKQNSSDDDDDSSSSSSYVSSNNGYSCELMLLTPEPLCSSSSSSHEEYSSPCYITSVIPASLPLRALHASRHCSTSYELVFPTSLIIVAVFWIATNYAMVVSGDKVPVVFAAIVLIIGATGLNVYRRTFASGGDDGDDECSNVHALTLITCEVVSGSILLVGASSVLVGLTQFVSFQIQCSKFIPKTMFASSTIRRVALALTALLCLMFSPMAPIIIVFAAEFVGRCRLQNILMPTTAVAASNNKDDDEKENLLGSNLKMNNKNIIHNSDNVFVRHAQTVSRTFTLNVTYVRLISVLALICTLPNMILTIKNVAVSKIHLHPFAHTFFVHDFSNMLLAMFLFISCLCLDARASPFSSASSPDGKKSFGCLRMMICVIISLLVGEPLVLIFDCSQLRSLLVWCGLMSALTLQNPKELFVF